MSPDDPRILDVALAGGRLAATVCQRVQREDNQPGVGDKARAEPVTIADYASQALILRELSRAFPDHGIVSEEDSTHLRESMDGRVASRIAELCSDTLGEPLSFDQVCDFIDWSGGAESDYRWAIDPIDGTKGFLRGDQYAVAIGLLYKDEPIAGVLACPNLLLDEGEPDGVRGVALLANRGFGAYQEALDGSRRTRIQVSDTADPAAVRVLGSVESSHGDPKLITSLIEDLGLGEMVRVDSQVKYGVLARGGAEVYLRPRSRPDYRDNVWDHVAGYAVAVEAGARCTDQDGKALDFSHGAKLMENRGVLVSHGPLHDQIVASIQRVSANA